MNNKNNNSFFLVAGKLALQNIQKERGRKVPLGLVQDVSTRWNSQLYMVRRLLELKSELRAVCHGGMFDGKPVLAEKDLLTVWPNDNQWKVRTFIFTDSLIACFIDQYLLHY